MKKIRTLNRVITIITLAIMLTLSYGLVNESAYATGGLSVKAGFYGGPYYNVKTFSSGQLSSMSGGVNMYTGVDSGGFMRVCFAYGVPFSKLISSAGVNTGSIKYIHMKTSDGYGEGYTTFTAGKLLSSYTSYPNITYCVNKDGSNSQQQIGSVPPGATSGAKSVPTILALGYTNWDRSAVIAAARWKEEMEIETYQEPITKYRDVEVIDPETGEVTGYTTEEYIEYEDITRELMVFKPDTPQYKSYSKGSLSAGKGYRLIYGQSGISGNNVGTSDHSITEIEIQLSGAPNITTEKKLIEGKKGEIGSKYEIKIKVSLPDSYSYLSAEAVKSLEAQILADIKRGSYDKSTVKVTKKADGTYIAEIIGEGSNTDVQFTYSRQEYGGARTTAACMTSIGGADQEGQGSDTGKESGEETGEDDGDNSGKNIGLKEDADETKTDEKASENKTAAARSNVKWMAADELIGESENNPIVGDDNNHMGAVGAAAAALLLGGFGGTIAIYRRRR